MAELENVVWRTRNGVSNLHLREPGTLRTRCGLTVPEHGRGAEVLDAADLDTAEWEGLTCDRCFPELAVQVERPSRARWQPRDRAHDLAVGSHRDLWTTGALELWTNGRGASLIRLVDRWQLRQYRPGATGRYDTVELVDGRRPRLKPPTGWANRVLRTGQS